MFALYFKQIEIENCRETKRKLESKIEHYKILKISFSDILIYQSTGVRFR